MDNNENGASKVVTRIAATISVIAFAIILFLYVRNKNHESDGKMYSGVKYQGFYTDEFRDPLATLRGNFARSKNQEATHEALQCKEPKMTYWSAKQGDQTPSVLTTMKQEGAVDLKKSLKKATEHLKFIPRKVDEGSKEAFEYLLTEPCYIVAPLSGFRTGQSNLTRSTTDSYLNYQFWYLETDDLTFFIEADRLGANFCSIKSYEGIADKENTYLATAAKSYPAGYQFQYGAILGASKINETCVRFYIGSAGSNVVPGTLSLVSYKTFHKVLDRYHKGSANLLGKDFASYKEYLDSLTEDQDVHDSQKSDEYISNLKKLISGRVTNPPVIQEHVEIEESKQKSGHWGAGSPGTGTENTSSEANTSNENNTSNESDNTNGGVNNQESSSNPKEENKTVKPLTGKKVYEFLKTGKIGGKQANLKDLPELLKAVSNILTWGGDIGRTKTATNSLLAKLEGDYLITLQLMETNPADRSKAENMNFIKAYEKAKASVAGNNTGNNQSNTSKNNNSKDVYKYKVVEEFLNKGTVNGKKPGYKKAKKLLDTIAHLTEQGKSKEEVRDIAQKTLSKLNKLSKKAKSELGKGSLSQEKIKEINEFLESQKIVIAATL